MAQERSRFTAWRKKGIGLTLLVSGFPMLATSHASERVEAAFAQLKEAALKKSSTLQIAEENLKQATSHHHTAWTHWIPRLDLQLSQTRSQDFSILTSGSLGNLANTLPFSPQAISLFRWQMDLQFPLYQRSVYLGISQSLAERDLARSQLSLQQTELDWRMRSLLGNYLTQKYKEAALQTSIQIAEQSLREATLRFELGQRTQVDVLRAKANLLSLQSKKLAFEQQKSAALHEFLEYTGLSPEELNQAGLASSDTKESEQTLLELIQDFTQVDPMLSRMKPYLDKNIPPSTLEAQITQSSPSYATLLSQEELSHRKAQSISAQEWPEVFFRGSLNKQSDPWLSSFSSDHVSYSAALLLRIPVFSGGSFFSTRSSETHAQKANQLKTYRDLLHLKNEIENDRNQIRSLLATLEAQNLNLEQNQELVRLSFKSYQLGKATLIELLTAQNDLIDSKISLAQIKQDLSTRVRKMAWNIGVPLP